MPSEMLGVRLSEREETEIKRLVDAGYFVSASDFIRDAVRTHLASIRIVESRRPSKAQARKEILNYLEMNGESYASDIAEALGLDLNLVFDVLKELQQEARVE